MMNSKNKTIYEPEDFTIFIDRKFAAKEWKNITKIKISGIYKIINKTNGKYYVGSSVDVFRRWNSHLNHLIKNKHNNTHLQFPTVNK